MNPRQRLLAAMHGGPVDRVPLVLEGLDFPSHADVDGHPDPGRREIGHRVPGQTAFFVHHSSHVNRYLVTPPQRIHEAEREVRPGAVRITSRIDTPLGPLTAIVEENTTTDTIWTVKYPVESREDIESIRSVPWELPDDLQPQRRQDLPAGWEERGILHTRISSPFVCAAGMMPYDAFLELCATDLPLLVELTEQCTARILDVLDVLLGTPLVEYVWIGGCEWLTPPMASGALYERLVQPFEAQLIERAHRAGALCHVHCHGRVRSTLPRVTCRGADFFEPMEPPPDGDTTMAEGKALAADRMTLGGNLEARLLAFGEEEDVAQATRAAFEGGKERMVLQTTAGPLGPMTPRMVANYRRMISIWEELSPL